MPTEDTAQQTAPAATDTAPAAPKPNDIATVTVVKSPVKHSGTVYQIGKTIEDEFHHFEAMIESGILRLEGFVEGKPAKK